MSEVGSRFAARLECDRALWFGGYRTGQASSGLDVEQTLLAAIRKYLAVVHENSFARWDHKLRRFMLSQSELSGNTGRGRRSLRLAAENCREAAQSNAERF